MHQVFRSIGSLLLALAVVCCVAPSHSLAQEQSTSAGPQEWKAALALSGGISLGAYEAGMNWALVKTLKEMRAGRIELPGAMVRPNLVAVTGASAGGINALATTIQWCANPGQVSFPDSIENNIHRRLWMGVGFDSLLPASDDGSTGYGADDGLLSRMAFTGPIDELRAILEDTRRPIDASAVQFDPGCDIGFGLSLTLERPLDVTVVGVQVPMQALKVPMRVSVKEGRLRVEPVGELLPGDGGHSEYISHIALLTDQDGKVRFDEIRKAILATSAFPIAFGRITLGYCYREKLEFKAERSKPDLGCTLEAPTMRVGEFVDGGVFDNIPLDVAIDLAGIHGRPAPTLRAQQARDVNYIYLDPDRRRTAGRHCAGQVDEARPQTGGGNPGKSYGLFQQGSFLTGAVRSGRTFQLFNTLVQNKDYFAERKNLFLSDRYLPITGVSLSAFGAFMDKRFRELDYLVGVYDAAVDMAATVTEKAREAEGESMAGTSGRPPHLEQVVQLLVQHLLADAGDASRRVLERLYCEEFMGGERCGLYAQGEQEGEVLPHLLDALLAASRAEGEDRGAAPGIPNCDGKVPRDVSFEELAVELNTRGLVWKDMDLLLASARRDPARWYEPLALRATRRLARLQEEAAGAGGRDADRDKKVAGITNALLYLANGNFVPERAELKFSDTPLPGESLYKHLLPYEFGVDFRNGGVYLAWSPRQPLPLRSELELKIVPLAMPSSWNRHEVARYGSAEIGLRKRLPWFTLSSVGVMGGYLRDWNRMDYGDGDAEIAGFNVGLLGEKIRVSVEARMHYGGEGKWAFLLGFSDLPGLVNAIVPTAASVNTMRK